MKKLLITGAWRCTDEQCEALVKMGYDITFMPDERGALPEGAEDAELIVCNGLFLYHEHTIFPKLVAVQLTSAGLDRVPIAEMSKRGIEVFNARGVYSVPMAEYALFGVLSLYKESRFFDAAQRAHEWRKHRGILEIKDKRVLIVGAGNVGTECAVRFRAFGARVYGVDLYPREDESYEKILPLDRLGDELSLADIIVLTLPLTERTRHLIDKDALACVKPSAVLVNIARAAVVDTAALISALTEGRIFGAVLDVFEEEPLSAESPVWDMENVIVTPHNSFVGDGNAERLFGVIKNNLERFS